MVTAANPYRDQRTQYDPGMGMDELCDALNLGKYIGVLAPSGGEPTISAAIISFLQSGIATRARTMQDKGRDSVCIYEWLTDAQIADVEAGTLLVDVAAAVRACIADVATLRVKEIEFPGKGYLLATQAVQNTTLADGLRFKATGSRDGLNTPSDVMFKYTGAADCWDIRNPDGSTLRGGWVWEGFTFKCTDNAAGMFSINFLDSGGAEYNPDDASTPDYVQDVSFKNCKAWGAGGGASQTGDFLKACKAFHIKLDSQCFVRGWRRGAYLKGCDNNRIDARMYLNGRNVHLEANGTFGNSNVIGSNWLGESSAAGSENMYCFYDAANATKVLGTQFEPTGAERAAIYMNGRGGRYFGIKLSSTVAPIFELGADANDYEWVNPTSTVEGSVAPIIATSTSAMDDANLAGNWQGLTLVNPNRAFTGNLAAATYRATTRVRIIYSGMSRSTDSLGRIGNEIITNNGASLRNYTITAANYAGQSSGTGKGTILVVADSASYLGSAIQIAATNNKGFLVRFEVGRALQINDVIKLRYFYKMSGSPGAGTFRWLYTKNFAGGSNGALTVSATYTFQDVYTTLAGFTAGDTFDVGAFNSSVVDQTCNIAAILVEVLDPVKAVSADNGDAAKTLDVGVDEETQVWNTAIGADRAVALSTTGAYNGAKFRIVRTANATGGFNLNVGTGPLKAMGTAGSFCEVEYNGAAWFLSAYGTL